MVAMVLTHILLGQTLRFAAPAVNPDSGSLDLRRTSYLEVRVFAEYDQTKMMKHQGPHPRDWCLY